MQQLFGIGKTKAQGRDMRGCIRAVERCAKLGIRDYMPLVCAADPKGAANGERTLCE